MPLQEPNMSAPSPERPDNGAKTRDEDMKPGSPPRPATEPAGSKGSSRNPKTLTDPATGEPQRGAPKPS
jgi:hypothetical protein